MRDRLSTRFTILVVLVIVLSFVVYTRWSLQTQRSFGEAKALAEAQVLNQEMQAAWDYVSAIQFQINHDSNGTYHFKSVYCSIAAKDIARRFMSSNDYVIRYVRENPRSGYDQPDEYESTALALFESGEAEEYYGTGSFEGEQVFRYVSKIEIDQDCLKCHGSPAGEPDETGFLKEGMQIGDVAGAASIMIPMSVYEQEIELNATRNVAFFVTLVVVIAVVLRMALFSWVTRPMRQLETAAHELGSGNMDATIDTESARGEMGELLRDFSSMAQRLRESYANLEEKVANRTSELAEANDELAEQRRQIMQVNDALQVANERLREEVAYQANFLAIMSHELKTPLASIVAFADIWEKSADKGSTDTSKPVEEIKENCQILLRMVDNILDAAKLESGRFPVCIEEIDLVDVVNKVEAAIEPLARKKNIALEVCIDPEVPIIQSDWEALRKILMNLLGNAVKFTEQGGAVKFCVICLKGEDAVQVIVEDNGIGISEENKARVFDRFTQCDTSLSRRHQGSGLGLSVVRDMVTVIGGKVGVESELGKGSRFTVTLPIHPIIPLVTDDSTDQCEQRGLDEDPLG
ncbi:MAG: ATP-binding protein [Coriobacteriia bacterium]